MNFKKLHNYLTKFNTRHTHSPHMLIIGLQNPGKEYMHTRHNAGALFVDALHTHLHASAFSSKNSLQSDIAEHFHNSSKIILAKPHTFMNTSGAPTHAITHYYKTDIAQELFIAHDDLDLPLGEYKISHDKNAAGHNGVQDIINTLGTKNFSRIRIGIDARTVEQRTHQSGADYVLGRFAADEILALDKVFARIIQDLVK